jgi:hypothetical protein
MSRIPMVILAACLALTAAIMWLLVAEADDSEFAVRRMLFALVLSIGALGLALVGFDMGRLAWGRRLLSYYWWAGRVLAFFAAIAFGYLAAFAPELVEAPPGRPALLLPFALILGVTLPLLMYALWGSSWGPLGQSDQQRRTADASDMVIFWLRVAGSVLVLLVIAGAAIFRVLKYTGALQ